MRVTLDLAGQARRRQEYLAAIRQHHRAYFDDAGAWNMPTPPAANREWLWDVFAWLDGNTQDREYASRLILNAPDLGVEPNSSGAGANPQGPYHVFSSTHAINLLVAHGESLTSTARRRLEGWAGRTVMDNPGGARADLQFHGYNDNMPAKATLGLILGGEYFGQRRAVEQGLWNLHQLRLLLARRGVISEHCSPTYTPLTLTNLAEIVHYAVDAEARELASACCEHIWAELLAHYHAPTRSVAGPYSRAYATDSAGHLGNLHYLLWQVFGADFMPDPRLQLFGNDTRLIVHHSGDRFFVEAGFTFMAACQHQPPLHLVQWMEQRQYPFDFAATTERGEGRPWGDFSPSRVHVRLHQTPTFALGTSNGDWTQSSERWHLVYRRTKAEPHAVSRGYEDVRQLTVRYLVNDMIPGKTAVSPRGETSGEIDHVSESAHYHTLQHEGLSMVVARPFASLADGEIERMGLAIVIPEHVSEVADLRVEDDHIWLQDGPFMLMIRPLGIHRWSEETPEVSIIRFGAYRLIYLPNYVGPARRFSKDELQGTTSAFVAAAASSNGITPEAFHAAVMSATTNAATWINQCTLSWQGLGHRLELCHGLFSHGLRYATVDGREPATPLWQAKGLPHEALPLSSTAAQANPYPFPYEEKADGWDLFPSRASVKQTKIPSEDQALTVS